VTADATAPSGRSRAAGTAGTLAGQLMMHTAEQAARLLKVKRSWLERQATARKIPFPSHRPQNPPEPASRPERPPPYKRGAAIARRLIEQQIAAGFRTRTAQPEPEGGS
jgi:hypothetical protein